MRLGLCLIALSVLFCVAGAIGLFLVQHYTDVHLLLYASVGITICFVCSYLASLAVPRSKKSIQGLTIHTLQRSDIL